MAGEQHLAQWFVTFFTYLTILSNKVTRFTLKTLMVPIH